MFWFLLVPFALLAYLFVAVIKKFRKQSSFTNTLNGKTLKQVPTRKDESLILGTTVEFMDRSKTMNYLKKSAELETPMLITSSFQDSCKITV